MLPSCRDFTGNSNLRISGYVRLSRCCGRVNDAVIQRGDTWRPWGISWVPQEHLTCRRANSRCQHHPSGKDWIHLISLCWLYPAHCSSWTQGSLLNDTSVLCFSSLESVNTEQCSYKSEGSVSSFCVNLSQMIQSLAGSELTNLSKRYGPRRALNQDPVHCETQTYTHIYIHAAVFWGGGAAVTPFVLCQGLALWLQNEPISSGNSLFPRVKSRSWEEGDTRVQYEESAHR